MILTAVESSYSSLAAWLLLGFHSMAASPTDRGWVAVLLPLSLAMS